MDKKDLNSIDSQSQNSTEYDYLLTKEKSQLKIKEPSKSFLKKLDSYDKKISSYIHNLEVNCFIEYLIYIFARMYNVDIITYYFIFTFIYFAYYYNNYTFIIRPLIHVILILILTLLSKSFFGRGRPNENNEVKRLFNCRNCEKNCSMPSGDSMQASNFAILILFYFGHFFGFFLVPFVMFARIFYFCHYVFDTVIGALMGFFISYILVFGLDFLFKLF